MLFNITYSKLVTSWAGSSACVRASAKCCQEGPQLGAARQRLVGGQKDHVEQAEALQLSRYGSQLFICN